MKKILFVVVLTLLAVLAFGCDAMATPHEHTFGDSWTYNEVSHWHAAECEHSELTKDMAAHTFNASGVCTACGYAKPQPAHEHTFSDGWTYNEVSHWHVAECEHSELTKDMAAHTFNASGVCTACGYEKVKPVYTVTFVTNCDLYVEPISVKEGEVIEQPKLIREGYNILNWCTDATFESNYNFAAPVQSNLMLYAKWAIKQYKITFFANDGKWEDAPENRYKNVLCNYGELPVIEVLPLIEDDDVVGYRFIGWKDNATGNMGLHITSANCQYDACFEKYYKACHVTFYDFAGEIHYEETLLWGEKISKVPDGPAVGTEHYHFGKWVVGSSTSEVEFNGNDAITSIIEVYPIMEIDPKFTLTVEVGSNEGVTAGGKGTINGGSGKFTATYWKGTQFRLVRDYDIDGGRVYVNGVEVAVAAAAEDTAQYDYWMGGWIINGESAFGENFTLNADTVVVARIGRYTQDYCVTWVVDGVTVDSKNWQYGTTPSYKGTPQKEGFVFTGWSPEVAKVTAAVTYTATFRPMAFAVSEGTDSVTVTGFGDYATKQSVIVPETINGKPVVAVAANALKNNSVVKEVTLPSTIKSVATGAFNGCSALCTVTVNVSYADVSGGDVSLDASMVSGCDKVYAIMLADNIIVVKYSQTTSADFDFWDRFKYGSDLGDVTCYVMPTDCTNLQQSHLFDGAPFVMIAVPHITGYGSDMIVNCPNLKMAVVGCLNYRTFANCQNLETVVFNGTKSEYKLIGAYAFENCPNLKRIACTDGVIEL